MSCKILENGKVIEDPREQENIGEYDVVVCGGGMAGFGSAIAAARHNARVLLIEKATALGGLATVGLVPIPMDTPAGISAEMLTRLETVDGHFRRNSDPEKHKLILDRMIREAGIDLLLDTVIVDAVMSGDQVRGAVVESKSGRQVVFGKRFIDCTGDADLAYFAGCECFEGRPEDGKHQACSLDFRLGGAENMTDGWGRTGADRQFRTTPCDIPYRTLVPVKLDNLLVAGRCLSSEFMVQAASRLIMTCLNMGQAAGTAAAQSLKEQVVPRKIDVKALLATLKADRSGE